MSDVTAGKPNTDPSVVMAHDIGEFLDRFLPDHPHSESTKVVHDGLWGTLRLTPPEVAIVNTPLVQRLRYIRQMGLASLTYPSATHSRFEHTLGVMYNVQKLCDALRDDPTEKRIGETEIARLRSAALLHDIGHGLLSHSSEEVYGSLPCAPQCFDSRYAPHEAISRIMLGNPRLKAYCEEAYRQAKSDVSTEEIAGYIAGECSQSDPKHYLCEVINGPFDADKLDYLFRDSHFSGLPLSVDLQRLWYTVRIGNVVGQPRLIVRQSGATPIEQILFSKMVLFSTVYHHHKVRACDCMLAAIFECIRKHGPGLEVRGRKLSFDKPSDFLWITDEALLSYGYSLSEKTPLHRLIHDLFFRRLLKRAIVISRKTVRKSDEDKFDDLLGLARRNADAYDDRRRHVRAIWEAAGKPCGEEQVWLDLPQVPNLNAANDTYVQLTEGGEGGLVRLSEIFPAEQWPKQYESYRWRGHVFCPPDCRDSVAAAAKDYLQREFHLSFEDDAFTLCKVKPPR